MTLCILGSNHSRLGPGAERHSKSWGYYESRTRLLHFLHSSNALEIQVVAKEDKEMVVTCAYPTPRLSTEMGDQNQLGAFWNTHALISSQTIFIWLDGKRDRVVLQSFPHDLDRPRSTHKIKAWKRPGWGGRTWAASTFLSYSPDKQALLTHRRVTAALGPPVSLDHQYTSSTGRAHLAPWPSHLVLKFFKK